MKIAICGGTLSGATLARVLSSSCAGKNIQIDIHTCLHDPARAKPHPLCEYEPFSFVIPEDESTESQQVRDEVSRWKTKEWVELCGSDDCSSVGAYDNATGSYRSMTMANGADTVTNYNRYQPTRGFFTLIDKLITELPSDRVSVSKNQLIALESTNDNSNRWFLKDNTQKQHGPYDLVLFAYDATPRAARKASFKQLLESALPTSSNIISSLARAVSASAMTVIITFPKTNSKDKTSQIPFDSIVFEEIPALRFATRNRLGDAASHRGMRVSNNSQKNEDIWTLVATPEWSFQVRNSHGGKWDKQAVGKEIVAAFARCVGQLAIVEHYKNVNPPFHWQGSSSLTKVDHPETPPFSYDADASLGFCGDIFGGQGTADALSSAMSLAHHLNLQQYEDDTLPDLPSSLPNHATHWVTRELQDYDDDTNSIVGTFTGRKEPADGLDHTWPTAVAIANGKVVNKADSLAKYRNQRNNNKSQRSPSRKNRNSSAQQPRRNR
mmetsp:Transcript_32572/g.36263  ORF Transcript_32572/g.36263 Transcript_32572/m.36263 type:complete len:496 (+) Transcript_32572:36-1523(+)